MHNVRAVLAALLAIPYFLLNTVAPVVGEQTYTAVFTLSAPAEGQLQLFYDDGTGFTEEHSSKVPAHPGMNTYELPLPTGTLTGLRLDPGQTSGRYIIQSGLILRPDGGAHAALDVSQFTAFNELAVIERSGTRLTVESPIGSLDPHLVMPLMEPLSLPHRPYTLSGLAATLMVMWCLAFATVVTLEKFAAPIASRCTRLIILVAESASGQPGPAILVAAALATAASTYPVLFFDRSLVSPGNGSIPMLYDHAPFTPDSVEFGAEDTRGSDVGAMMWALVPYSNMQRAALTAGEWPLWARNNGAGRPLWGQGQTFFFDPLHWLALVGDDPAPGWDLKFVAHRFVFSAGIGAAAWLATRSLWAAAAVAAVAPFAGYYTFRFSHPATFAPTFGPWILVGWFMISRASRRTALPRGAFVLALSSALVLLASPPKEAVIMLAACHLTGVMSLLLSQQEFARRSAGLLAALGAGIAMVLLTTPHWLVFLETLAQARTQYDFPSVHLATLASLQGFVLGNLSPGSLQPGLNAIAVTFAVVALAHPAELNQKRELAACLIAAILLIGLVAGAVPTAWLLQIPLIRNVGHLADTVITALMVPTLILTAAGLRAAVLARPSVLALFCVPLAAGGIALWLSNGGVAGLHQFHQWLLLFVLGLSSVAPLVVSTARRYPGRFMPVLCSGMLIFGVSGLGGLHLLTGIPALDELLPQPRLRGSLDANSPAVDAALRQLRYPVRTIGEGNLLFQGTEALYELEGIGGPDALSVGPYEELLDAGGMAREWGWRTKAPSAHPEQIDALLDMLNVGLIVKRQAPASGMLSSDAADGDAWIDVVTRPSAWPRAYFVDGVGRYDDPVQLIDLARSGEGPFAAIAATDPNAFRLTSHLADRRTVSIPASQYVLTTNSTRFEVDATGPGIAVLSETYLPGDFRATVNGQPADYFRVNHAFKAVVIPAAGTWDIVFEYRPAHWGIAWAAAACGAAMLTALAVACVGRAPGRGEPVES